MRCVSGGVAPSLLKDKHFRNILRNGVSFVVTIAREAKYQMKPSILRPIFIAPGRALRRRTWRAQRFF